MEILLSQSFSQSKFTRRRLNTDSVFPLTPAPLIGQTPCQDNQLLHEEGKPEEINADSSDLVG